MINKVIDIIKEKPYTIPKILLSNYRKLDITEKELVILIYLINNNAFNSESMALELNMDMNDILKIIDGLDKKDLAKIEVKKENSKINEYISLDGLYSKLALTLVGTKDEVKTNVYEHIEQEFGRTLSPVEYELVLNWKEDNFSDELILESLKEAIYNGVTNLKYMNTILYEWRKKGIKSKEDIKVKNKKETKKELFEYDWLNEDE